MQFCTLCDNMYYITLNTKAMVQKRLAPNLPDTIFPPGNKLTYYCRKCGHEDENIHLKSGCITETVCNYEHQKIRHLVNPYTKYDVTLPRVRLLCPNDLCCSNTGPSPLSLLSEEGGGGGGSDDKKEENVLLNEVICIRYDDEKMKFLYICVQCDSVWKSK